jgi:Na+-driven multidrug efflux pump
MTFTNKDLKNMIIPLFFEQLLVMLVGIIDTFIVSFVGESAVSGVSLVNSFNAIFINLFTTLASDGAVVISQYIGRKEEKIDYEEKYWSTAGIISGTGNCSRSNSK